MADSSGDEVSQQQVSRRSSSPRHRGSGGIFAVREGVWRVDIELPRDPVTRRRRRASRQVQGTRKDAEIALSRLRVAHEERRLPSSGTRARNVRHVFDIYLAAAESGQIQLAPRTIITTRSAANTMSSTQLLGGRQFGHTPLSKLSWQTIEDQLYGEMKSAGLGSDWIRRCATVLSRALDFARKRGLIDANPAKDATRPKATRTKPFAPTVDEVRTLLNKVRDQDEEFADAVTVLAGTGMRKAELLGLQWADVDLDRDELHVAAAITDAGPGQGVIRKSTKKSDWRDIPLANQTRKALVRQHDRHQRTWSDFDEGHRYVFSSPSGPDVPWRPDSFTDRWSYLRGSSTITLQQLRHFAATVMLDAGESYRTVADLLGNSENTLRLHYDGRTDIGKRRAIAALDL
jgi:integrase